MPLLPPSGMCTHNSWNHLLSEAKRRLGPLRWHALLLFVIWRLGDLASMAYKFVLMRWLPPLDFGVIEPVFAVVALLSVPVTIIYQTSVKSISRLAESGRHAESLCLSRHLVLFATAGSLFSVAAVFLLEPYILERLHVTGSGYVWLIMGSVVLSWWAPLALALVQGHRAFLVTWVDHVLRPVLLLALSVVFVRYMHWGPEGAIFASVCAGGFSVVVVLSLLRSGWRGAGRFYADEWALMRGMLLPMAFFILGTRLLDNFDRLLIRNFFLEDSGGYGVVVTLGQIPRWCLGPLLFVIFPLVSAEHAGGRDTTRYYHESVRIGLLVIVGSAIFFYFAASPIIRALNPSYLVYARYVWIYAVAAGALSLLQIVASAEMARHCYGSLWYLVMPTIAMCIGMYVFRRSLDVHSIVAFITITRLTCLLGMVLHTRLRDRRDTCESSGIPV